MRFEVVIWAELPSFLPQTTVKPDRPVCWDGKWMCETFYSVSGWGDRQLPTLASGSVAIQFLHFQSYWFTASFSAFANPQIELICITVLLLCIFLGSGLFH